MLRNQIDESPQDNAEFPLLPPAQTVSFILSFLTNHLPSFSTTYLPPRASHLEDDISEELLSFLQDRAKSNNLLIHFNARKGVDFLIKVGPFKLNAKPFFVIEAKRLSKKHYDYVRGRTGGIERLKREQEGFDHNLVVSGMLGYIQENSFAHWHQRVNAWIEALIAKVEVDDDIRWEQQDLLKEFSPSTAQLARYTSIHSRKTQMDIKLHHFWLNMHD